MYAVSRLFLMAAVVLAVYCLAVMSIMFWPLSGWLLGILAVAYAVRRPPKRPTALGQARFANERDLRKSGMVGGKSGLIIGRVPSAPERGLERARRLFDWNIGAEEACRRHWSRRRRNEGEIVRLSRSVHTAIFAPSGQGKGVSILTPHAMDCPDSMVIFDPKGELAQRTARLREKKFRHRAVLVDPYRLVTRSPDCFNVFDAIDKQSPHLIDECNDLGEALIVRTGEERERHWDDSAAGLVSAMSTAVALYGERGESRSLQTVREFVSHPQKLELAVRVLCECDLFGGIPARMGGQLLHLVDKEKASVLTTVGRHLRFLDSPAVVESTRASSFDPAELRKGRMTIYLILPPEHLRAQAGLARMWITSLLRAVVRGGLQE